MENFCINCFGYPYSCNACQSMSSLVDHYPLFNPNQQKKQTVKFKTFFGYMVEPIDEAANKWLVDNPDITVIDFKYAAHPHGHSICIMYEEVS